ncbi:MAG: hypothetical protein Q4B50_00185 [Bacillota bacterium]|nr:hypothetical protein [Bacillota bacterium]
MAAKSTLVETKKQLKTFKDFCIFWVLIIAVSIINSLITFFRFDLAPENLPGLANAALEEQVLSFLIIILIINLLIHLVNLFLAIKGIRISAAPGNKKGHIVLGTVMCVLYAIATLSSISALFNSVNLFTDLLTAILNLCNLAILIIYISMAKKIRLSAKSKK